MNYGDIHYASTTHWHDRKGSIAPTELTLLSDMTMLLEPERESRFTHHPGH